MTSDADEQRAALRKRVIAQRDALTEEQLRAGGRGLARVLTSTPEYADAASFAAYWPVKGEADVGPCTEQALRDGKRVYLPIVGGDGFLLFAPYEADTPLRRNRLRIPEPDVPSDQLVAPRDLDLVLVPLTVFDGFGNRLGMGGGYYDRSFAFLNENPRPERPLLVGAAHEFQYTERLPTCAWDVPAHMVVTEERVWRPRQPDAAAI